MASSEGRKTTTTLATKTITADSFLASSSDTSLGIEEPLDLVKLSLDEIVLVKMKGEKELVGKLHAFDQHMNLVLGDVEETRRVLEAIQSTEVEGISQKQQQPQSFEWRTQVRKRGMLFVRGDAIILLAPCNKTREY